MGGMNLEHMSFQCKVSRDELFSYYAKLIPLPFQAIETILERYREIFVEEEEAPPA